MHESHKFGSLSVEKNSGSSNFQREFLMSPVPLLNESFDILDEDEIRWDPDFDSFTVGGNESGADPLPSFQSFLDKPERSLSMGTKLSTNNSHTQTLACQSDLWPTALAKSSDTTSLPGTTTDSFNSFLSLFLLQNEASISTKLANQIKHKKVTLRDLISLGLGVLESGFSQATDTEESEDSPQLQAKDNLKTKNHIRAGTGKERFVWKLKLIKVDLILSPHLGTIRVTQVSFLSACLSNAAMLGLTPATTSNDAESPFYHGHFSKQAEEWQRSEFKNIKRDLRPTKSQLARSHHPYLDVLPFPTFRERAIALIHADTPVFDEEELCRDLLNDALVCWGSSLGAGIGNSGAPWDIRSWEARPWFMKKWWFLTGGIEGELYQQTRWWCEMRGDDSGYAW
ncbi:hypothetical protein GGI42DRAFT_319595 [Trichoderma sp. SZMC 28013]